MSQCLDFNLGQLVNFHTSVTGSTSNAFDLVLSSSAAMLNTVTLLDSLNDHKVT